MNRKLWQRRFAKLFLWCAYKIDPFWIENLTKGGIENHGSSIDEDTGRIQSDRY